MGRFLQPRRAKVALFLQLRRAKVVRFLSILTCLSLITFIVLFIIPIRNVVFYAALRPAWEDVSTADLYRIHFARHENSLITDGYFSSVTCDVIRKPEVQRGDVNTSAVLTYPHLKQLDGELRALERSHGRFLPTLTLDQKVDYLYLFLVLSETLKLVDVEHFLVAGSLLGLSRHGGFVPWDDDLDVSVSFDQWELVKQTLSCVEGHQLEKFTNFHWKFHPTNIEFPFIDIFLYKYDESYVWALPHYSRITYIYPTNFVFPLTEAMFEGVKVPVPRNSLAIAQRIYKYDDCKAFKGHIEHVNATLLKRFPKGYSKTSLDCSELSYMYTMFNLKLSTNRVNPL